MRYIKTKLIYLIFLQIAILLLFALTLFHYWCFFTKFSAKDPPKQYFFGIYHLFYPWLISGNENFVVTLQLEIMAHYLQCQFCDKTYFD